MRNIIICFSALVIFLMASCGPDIHKQYAKCGSKHAKKKAAFYQSLQHK